MLSFLNKSASPFLFTSKFYTMSKSTKKRNESPRRKQRGIMLVNIYFFAASGGELTPKWLD